MLRCLTLQRGIDTLFPTLSDEMIFKIKQKQIKMGSANYPFLFYGCGSLFFLRNKCRYESVIFKKRQLVAVYFVFVGIG